MKTDFLKMVPFHSVSLAASVLLLLEGLSALAPAQEAKPPAPSTSEKAGAAQASPGTGAPPGAAKAPAGSPASQPAATPASPQESQPKTASEVLVGGAKKVKIELSLEDAIRLTIDNNLEMAIEILNRSIARREVIVQQAVFDPYFNLGFSYAKNRDPSISRLDINPLNPVTEVIVNPFDITTFRGGIRGLTPIGSTYQLSISEGRFNNPEAQLFGFNPRYTNRIEATVTQPLLKDGWYTVNSANLRIAKNNFQLSKEQFEITTNTTLQAVINAYWDLGFALRNYQSKTKALEVAEEQLRNDQLEVKVGTKAPLDLTTSESQVARRKTEIDQARSLLEKARDELLHQMNYTGKDSLKKLWELRDEKSPFDNVEVLPTTEAKTDHLNPDRTQALQAAFENRPEYRQIALQIKNQEIQVEVAWNALLPTFDLNAAWTQLGLDRNLGDSVDSTTSGRFYDWLVGLTFEVPILYRGPTSQYHNAREAKAKLVLQRQNLENTIVIEVDQAIRDLEFAYRAVKNLERQVAIQEELLKAERIKLRVGKSIAYTVTQIENDLIDIQAQELRAKADYEKAKAALLKAMGTLLKSRNITLIE